MKQITIFLVSYLTMIKFIYTRTDDAIFVCREDQFWDGIQCNDCLQGCSCSTTKIQDTCDACLKGYMEYNPQKITFSPGQFVCLNCSPECGNDCCFNYDSNVQVCSTCPDSYYLNDNWFCSQCLDPNCLKCDASGVCSTCKDGYFINTIGICQPCVGSNCLTCSNSGNCSTCPNGYYPDSTTGSCLLCSGAGSIDQNCLLCSSTNKTKCVTCKPFYYADGQGKCREVAYCDYIQPVGEKCLSCSDGYYQDTNGKCKQCPQFGVARCSSATTIIQCKSDRALTTDKSQCVYKINHCIEYDNTGLCITCDSAFTFNSKGQCIKTCQLAIPNCTTCVNGNNTTFVTCTQCDTGYFIGPGGTTCVACNDDNRGGMQGCDTCTDGPFACNKCLKGYFLDNTNTCKGCTPDTKGTGCLTCTDATTCSTCLTNTFGPAGTCNLCDVSCGECTDLGYRNCKNSCSSSLYFLDNTTQCLKCNTNMQACLQCTGKTTCSKCANSYFLSTNPTLKGTSKQCQLFEGCKVTNPGVACVMCKPGYKMINSGCIECQTSDCTKGCSDTTTVVVIDSSQVLNYSLLLFLFSLFILM